MTWEIFLGIVTLVAFVTAIVKPITKLTNTITELIVTVKGLKDSFAEIVSKNEEAHKRIWDHVSKQDTVLDNHEKRLSKMEITFNVEHEFEKEKEHIKE